MDEKEPLTPEQVATIERVNAGMDVITNMIQAELGKLGATRENTKFLLIVEPHDSPGMLASTTCTHCLIGMLGSMMERVMLGEGREVHSNNGPVH